MATITPRAIIWNTTAGNKTTGAFTPVAGELLVAIVGLATIDTAPTMSDSQGGTWTLVDVFRSNISASTGGLRMYVRNSAVTATSMTVTMTEGANAGGGLAVLSVAGADGYGASAIRQTNGVADVASGTPSVTLPQAILTANAVIGAVMTNTNGSANSAPPTGWTEHYDQGFNVPATGIQVSSINSGSTLTTVPWTAAAPSAFAAIVIEVLTPIQVAASDGGTGGDSSSVAATGTAAEAGAGDDTSTIAAVLTAADSGIAADTSSVQTGFPVNASDGGSGSDQSSLAALLSAADAAVAGDSSAITKGVAESGAGAETSGLTAMIGVVEGGSGGDGTGGGAAPVSGSDAGSSIDGSVLQAPLAASDSAVGAETSAIAVPVTVDDSAVGLELGQLVVPRAATDTAQGLDASHLQRGINAQDTAVGVDTAVQFARADVGPILYLHARYAPIIVRRARYEPALVLVGERA